MSVVLQIYAIIVTLSLIIVLSFYLLHRREVTRLSQKLQTLLHSFTHAELTLDFPSSDITDLVNALNELLRVYHKQVYSLQKKDEAIKETITNLAHDLRTPVTAIQGYTQMLLQSPELSEEDLDAAVIINERLNVLNQLLNQLFEFARIEADELDFSYTTFDLNAVLRSVAVSFFKSFEERKIIPALSIAEISFPFYGDEKAVTRTSQAYFPKDNSKEFDNDDTIVDWLTQYSPVKDVTYVRGFLGRMLFAGEDGVKKVRVLSGGEKVRCMLSKMMISGSNVLILDEPTDHLDMESITALNNGMIKFPGVLLFSSRDHQIVETTANRIMEIVNGKLIDKITTYDEYLANDEMARKRQVFTVTDSEEEDD